jgi:uncharacterized protein YwgA
MKRLQKAVVFAELANKLAEHGSWCGETHMQKAVYLLQGLTKQDLGYDYILYKHGPFSFDLADDLTGFRADGIFKLRPRPEPYGPTLVATEAAERLRSVFKITSDRFREPIQFVASAVGNKGVVELERLGTALYVTLEDLSRRSVEDRAARLHELKPHVSVTEATEAVKQIDKLREAANTCAQ